MGFLSFPFDCPSIFVFSPLWQSPFPPLDPWILPLPPRLSVGSSPRTKRRRPFSTPRTGNASIVAPPQFLVYYGRSGRHCGFCPAFLVLSSIFYVTKLHVFFFINLPPCTARFFSHERILFFCFGLPVTTPCFSSFP